MRIGAQGYQGDHGKAAAADDNGATPAMPAAGPPTPPAAPSATDSHSSNLDKVQLALDVGGMLPGIGVVFDIANAGIHAARGNWGEAAMSLVSAVPGIGDAAKAAVLAKKALVAAHGVALASKTVAKGGVFMGAAASRGALKVTKGGVYSLVEKTTGNVLRTGMTGNLRRRAAQHRKNPLTKDLEFKVLHFTDSYFERRGLEQMAYLMYQSTAVFNHQRALRPTHKLRGLYVATAKRYLKRNGKEIPDWFK
jgi:predicted GIY-YIG superfamily endonuclease